MSVDPKSTYYDEGGLETLEIIQAKLSPQQLTGYFLGNIIKYSCRLNFKGEPIRDAEKIEIYAHLLHEHRNKMSENNKKPIPVTPEETEP